MADRDWTIDAAHLPRHANEGTLERGRDDWAAAIDACDPAEADRAARARLREGENAALFDAVFANSPFLTQLALRHVPLCARLLATGPDAAMAHILDGLEQAFADPLSTADAGRMLRRARQQAALVVGLADLAGVWTLAEVTGALTDFADLAVRLALRTLIREGGTRKAWTLPDVPDPERHFGLVCLGMGKLGARELNYSSDIDLVLFHDDQWIDGARAGELNTAFGRVARGLTGLMDNRTVDGYVFRTDLRLRPDPGATPPVIALSAAETYYHSVGQTWERAAMIKARAICGHPGAVKDAQSILHPFVWRKHLDFYAIADVHAIKNQIHAHKGGAKITVRGHNIKLGRGGIREIEFFAQTQQLIWGGRLPALRVPATTKAIAALQSADLIGAKTAEEMVASYAYLRKLEHRLQMIDDRQTHTVPEDDEGLAHIAAFMGYPDAEPFAADLTAHLERVHRHYAVLFEEAARPRSTPGNLVFTGSDNDPETMETLRGLGFEDPERIAPLVRSWFAGRYRAMRTERANHLLTTMLPDILAAFGRTSSPDAAVVRFDRFISGLPSGVQLFSLLYANRHLIALLTELLGTAPRLAELLAADSGLFDAVLQPGFFEDLPTRERIDATLAERLEQAGDYQDALDTVRRMAAEVRFQVGVQMIHGGQTVDAAGNALSDLADAVICALLPWVADDFAQKYGTLPGGAFAVVALGKLGSRELDRAVGPGPRLHLRCRGRERTLHRTARNRRRPVLRPVLPPPDRSTDRANRGGQALRGRPAAAPVRQERADRGHRRCLRRLPRGGRVDLGASGADPRAHRHRAADACRAHLHGDQRGHRAAPRSG